MESSSTNDDQAIAAYLERAEESLEAAETLFESNFFRESVSQAYYSAFYAARACLTLEDIHPKTHSGTVAKFGEAFVKAGKANPKAGRVLNELEEDREKSDYEISLDISKEDARGAIEDAKFFLEAALDICQRKGENIGEEN